MARRTRSAVSGATRPGALSPFEAVWRGTPAGAATSEIVTPFAFRPLMPLPRAGFRKIRHNRGNLIVQIATAREVMSSTCRTRFQLVTRACRERVLAAPRPPRQDDATYGAPPEEG